MSLEICLRCVGRGIARYLNAPLKGYLRESASRLPLLRQALRPCDILLVDGDRRISVAIKYLTQSTWSHAALYVGDVLRIGGADPPSLVEADLIEGVRLVPLSTFAQLRTRVCRPIGLSDDDVQRVIRYAVGRIGHQYDLKNVFDLARYLLPTPPVPSRWRRRMLALGSGDPTRAICSTLIAQAFEVVSYPVLPEVETIPDGRPDCPDCTTEVFRIRHHSLYAPRDFDLSPYFEIVKPRLDETFQYHTLRWSEETPVLASVEAS